MKNGFFQLSDIPGSENSFSQGKRFLKNSSFRLLETNFLSSRNSIALFRALEDFKIRSQQHFLEKPYFCSWKLIFRVVEVNYFYFSNILASERFSFLAETYF